MILIIFRKKLISTNSQVLKIFRTSANGSTTNMKVSKKSIVYNGKFRRSFRQNSWTFIKKWFPFDKKCLMH